MPALFLNGAFLEPGAARVSAFDAGLQHGVGLFETMTALARAGETHVIDLERHLDRLVASARELGLSDSLRIGALAEAVVLTCQKAGHDRARVRLTITGGDMNLLAASKDQGAGSERRAPAAHHDPTVMIHAQPATEYPAEMFERGIAVGIADLRVNSLDPFAGHKTLNYWPRLHTLQIAASKRQAEALVFQITNHLAGGCVSNCLIVKDGRVMTPLARGEESGEGTKRRSAAGLSGSGELAAEPLHAVRQGVVMPSPVLPGVIRAWAMEACEQAGMLVQRRMVAIDDVLSADEVLLTNSSWGVLPVVKVEAEAIGDAVPGPVAERLVAMWRELVV